MYRYTTAVPGAHEDVGEIINERYMKFGRRYTTFGNKSGPPPPPEDDAADAPGTKEKQTQHATQHATLHATNDDDDDIPEDDDDYKMPEEEGTASS